mmetsp:Transcript_12052/g.18090  ORF Transcript_12052/g.18090 Transcript_12052/m.18090 type:complete len:568 (+) Transcript_12052:120-1823(+)
MKRTRTCVALSWMLFFASGAAAKVLRRTTTKEQHPQQERTTSDSSSSSSSSSGTAPHPKITQIIVLMMENRSFDHMLGYLEGVEGIPKGQSCPIDPNDPSKGSIPIQPKGYDISPDDPPHNYESIALQLNNGQMNGFVSTQLQYGGNPANPVSMFTHQTAPIMHTLAKEYAVFDHWYASVPGPTDPNRQFVLSGTSLGATTNFNGTLYPQQSYLDYVRKHGAPQGHTSGGYYQRDLWHLGYFHDLVHDPLNTIHIKELDQHFYTDLKNGALPTFTWLQPSTSSHYDSNGNGNGPTWQHPDASVREGERFIKNVYEAVRASPKWNETLVVITYDEHGGFYDHVVPPKNVPSPDDITCWDCEDGYDFTSLGVRIPTIAISPWISKGTVVSKPKGDSDNTSTSTNKRESKPFENSVFESTSIMATVNELLNLDAPPLGNRMAWSARFTYLINESKGLRNDTDCLKRLPDLPDAPKDIVKKQRVKEINEHLFSSMLFFCKQNYPLEFQEGVLCPSAVDQKAALNQGLASDWLKVEQDKFMKKQKQKQQEFLGMQMQTERSEHKSEQEQAII